MKIKILPFILCSLLISVAILSACSRESGGMQDGYYTAEFADFDQHGWKDFISVYVSGGQIITVEYDSFNASGFVKSWDIEYMRTMNILCGTYPNEFARAYSVSLINWQDPSKVDAITGATESHAQFQLLAEAVISQAKAGDKQVALVHFSE